MTVDAGWNWQLLHSVLPRVAYDRIAGVAPPRDDAGADSLV